MALKVLKWHEYVRDNKKFDDGKGGCWNDGPNNGYDLGVLVRSYMKSKGKSHMSFVEAVLEGEIEGKEEEPLEGFFKIPGEKYPALMPGEEPPVEESAAPEVDAAPEVETP